jgi:hypothetical protein
MSVRRSRNQRAEGLARLQSRLDAATGHPCIAIQCRAEDGTPAMLLMGDDCPSCREFRAAIPPPSPPPPPARVEADTVEDDW